jgi:hypothetical protein
VTVPEDGDPLGGQFNDPPTNDAVPVTEIEWDNADALPFPLCLSALVGTHYHEDVSVAWGNIVMADHGVTLADSTDEETFDPATVVSSLDPDTVPDANPILTKVPSTQVDGCEKQELALTPPRFRPRLKESPLTCAAGYDPDHPPASATATMQWSVRDAVPVITLKEAAASATWHPKHDLLNSGPTGRQFVVEIESDGAASLRFGDDLFGSRPASGTRFLATCRIGNGTRGNVGVGALSQIIPADEGLATELTNPVITQVTNPLPARGGVDPETIAEARQNAPGAFRVQERAVTPDDYAERAKDRCEQDVQRAAATFRWTGSWHTVFLTVDRLRGADVDDAFEQTLRRCLERYRMAGHDLEVDGPRYVSLEIEMEVCVQHDYFATDVEAALLELFSNRQLSDGRLSLFHPDNFTFGQAVSLSPLVAAAQSLAGVASVEVKKFQRQGQDSREALDAGRLTLERLEIARLDNDPNFPEHGVFSVTMKGGR